MWPRQRKSELFSWSWLQSCREVGRSCLVHKLRRLCKRKESIWTPRRSMWPLTSGTNSSRRSLFSAKGQSSNSRRRKSILNSEPGLASDLWKIAIIQAKFSSRIHRAQKGSLASTIQGCRTRWWSSSWPSRRGWRCRRKQWMSGVQVVFQSLLWMKLTKETIKASHSTTQSRIQPRISASLWQI